MVNAVIFDLLETLVTDYPPESGPAPGPLEELFGPRLREFHELWSDSVTERHAGRAVSYRDILVDACRRFDIVPDPRLIRAANAARIESKARPFLQADPQVAAAVQVLKQQRMRLGIISNCEREEVQAWSRWKPGKLFDDHLFSFRVGVTMPDPVIYRLACRRLKTEPANAVFVGEGARGQLDGARAAGLQTCRVTWFSSRWPSPRDHGSDEHPIAESPTELVRLVCPAAG